MSGTTISNLSPASSVLVTDNFPLERPGSPNTNLRATALQIISVLNTATLSGPITVTNPGTSTGELVNFSQFNPAVQANGAIALPGGITLQWGLSITALVSGIAIAVVNFEVAFSAIPYSITLTAQNQSANSVALLTVVGQPNISGFSAQSVAANTGSPAPGTTFYWFCVGPT